MAITPIDPNNPDVPNDLTESTPVDPSIPNQLTESTPADPAVPNQLTETTPVDPSVPNQLTEIAEGTPSVPNQLTETAAGTPAVPNQLTEIDPAAVPRVIVPLISLDFSSEIYSQGKEPVTFDELLTYSRGSSATFINRRVDRLGKYEYFVDTDFVGTVTNLLTYSEQFDQSDWATNNSSVESNVVENPVDGTRNADLIIPDATNGSHYISQSAGTVSDIETLSVYVKSNGYDWFAFQLGTSIAYFNVSLGVVGTVSSGIEASIQYAGDGWYKCSVSGERLTNTNNLFFVAEDDNDVNFEGDNVNGIYLWGGQLTESSKMEPYVQTISSSTSDTFSESIRIEYDPVTYDALGVLIEGSSTNLFTYSEDFDDANWTKTNANVTSNDYIAPDDTVSMDKIESDATATQQVAVSMSFTSTASNTYTMSFYAKASEARYLQIFFGSSDVTNNPRINFDLFNGVVSVADDDIVDSSISMVANGVYRLSVTVVAAEAALQTFVSLIDADTAARAASGSWTIGDGLYLWGAQGEEQPFATSYIKTESSTVSRLSDDLETGVAGSVSGNGNEFTSCVNFSTLGNQDSTSGQRMVISADGAPFYQTAATGGASSKYVQFYGGASQDYNSSSNNFTSGLMAFTYETNNTLSTYLDGVLISSGDSGTPFEPDNSGSIDLGNVGGADHLYGHIKGFKTYDVALTAKEISIL